MTIKDISRETGYSVGTISRVLNNHPNVSEKARKAVTEAIERFGFERNENAKNLKQQKKEGVLVLVKGRNNELFASAIERLQQIFASTGLPLFVDYFDETENEVRHALHLCAEKKPEGLLFLGGDCDNFREAFSVIHIPAVLVTGNASDLPFDNLSSVFTDDVAAADCAVSYLLAQGHRDIAIIGGDPSYSDTSRMRTQGAHNAMQRAGIDVAASPHEAAIYSFQGGYDTMRRILSSGRCVTAVFAMADVMAIGAMRALRDCGLRVPEDVSVCGFDGLQIGSYILPQLTTIRQSIDLIADRSARILLDSIAHNASARHESVPFTLDKRESVSPFSI